MNNFKVTVNLQTIDFIFQLLYITPRIFFFNKVNKIYWEKL